MVASRRPDKEGTAGRTLYNYRVGDPALRAQAQALCANHTQKETKHTAAKFHFSASLECGAGMAHNSAEKKATPVAPRAPPRAPPPPLAGLGNYPAFKACLLFPFPAAFRFLVFISERRRIPE